LISADEILSTVILLVHNNKIEPYKIDASHNIIGNPRHTAVSNVLNVSRFMLPFVYNAKDYR